MSRQSRQRRADHTRGHRAQYERNRKRLLKTSTHCALCGGELTNHKFPHPLSSVADHIIPIASGQGHPSSIDNLQIVHNACNLKKGASLKLRDDELNPFEHEHDPNRDLPQSMDWTAYRFDEATGESNQDELVEN